MLGKQGEFVVRNLEIREGKVHCETAFADVLELPFSAVRTIAFQSTSPAAGSTDTLVFKNGDELPGKALAAALGSPVRWRTASGQEVEFQPARVAGIRLAGDMAKDGQAGDSGAVVELRSGEQLRGKLLAFDEKQARLEHPQLGAFTVERGRLWRLFPNSQLKGVDEGSVVDGWTWTRPNPGHKESKAKTAGADPVVYLDGTYIVRGDGNNSSFSYNELPGLQHEMKPALDRFELRVQVTALGSYAANFLLLLDGKDDTGLNAYFSYSHLQINVLSSRGGGQARWRDIPLQDKLGDANARRALRLFVDTKAGTCDLVINGVHLVRLGQEARERLVKSQYTVRIAPYPGQGTPTILSNLWVGPWNGELPHLADSAEGSTALANGDVAPSVPKVMQDGRFKLESELGDLDLPLEKALVVDFGGAMDTQRAAARVRLADGSTINVDGFQWDGHELTAHSAILGDLRLPVGAVQELVFDPVAPHPLAGIATKKTAQADSGKKDEHP
jgi:hypothetical protein